MSAPAPVHRPNPLERTWLETGMKASSLWEHSGPRPRHTRSILNYATIQIPTQTNKLAVTMWRTQALCEHELPSVDGEGCACKSHGSNTNYELHMRHFQHSMKASLQPSIVQHTLFPSTQKVLRGAIIGE